MSVGDLINLADGSGHNSQVTVRLQVWHFSERGRCPEYNHGLARLFTPEALGDWRVSPADVVEPDDLSARDEYVPVEVDFVHRFATYNNDSHGNTQFGVRDIFKKLAPAIVYKYFVTGLQSPPHAMNIYATKGGQEMTAVKMKRKYAHSFFFFPLELRLKRFVKPDLVSEEDKVIGILQATAQSLPILQALVSSYMISQGGKIEDATYVFNLIDETLTELAPQLPWLEDIRDKVTQAKDESTIASQLVSEAPPVPMKEATDSFNQLRVLARKLEPRLTRLSKGEKLTNQGIIDTMMCLRQAMTHLSEYEQSMQLVDTKEFVKWNREVTKHGGWQWLAFGVSGIIGVATIAIMAFHTPDILAGLVAETLRVGGGPVAAASGAFAYDQKLNKDKALVARDNAQARATKGRIALQGVKKALEEVRTDLATIFLAQVMRQPIRRDQNQCMGHHELERAIRMLGGDVHVLGEGGYDRALIKDRFRNLVEKSQELDKMYQGTMDDLKLVMDEIGVVEKAA